MLALATTVMVRRYAVLQAGLNVCSFAIIRRGMRVSPPEAGSSRMFPTTLKLRRIEECPGVVRPGS